MPRCGCSEKSHSVEAEGAPLCGSKSHCHSVQAEASATLWKKKPVRLCVGAYVPIVVDTRFRMHSEIAYIAEATFMECTLKRWTDER